LGETEEPIQAIILAARELTLSQTASVSTVDRLRASFDDREVVELLFFVSLYNGIVRFLGTFAIEPEEEYLEYLALHPLP
jgi:alkylhydroperoxidase family enzyme